MREWFIVGMVLTLGILLQGCGQKNLDSFAQCLTDNNITMYGTATCSFCKAQKEKFGSSFVYVDYVECSADGPGANPELCREKGITGYPSWEIAGSLVTGMIPLEKLSEFSGCPLP